ncbi:hypothetical protein ABKV19_026564 [Rosa sericea]
MVYLISSICNLGFLDTLSETSLPSSAPPLKPSSTTLETSRWARNHHHLVANGDDESDSSFQDASFALPQPQRYSLYLSIYLTFTLCAVSTVKLLCAVNPCELWAVPPQALFSTHIVGEKPVLVRDFIHSALYDPRHGYFAQRSRSVGVLQKATKFNH